MKIRLSMYDLVRLLAYGMIRADHCAVDVFSKLHDYHPVERKPIFNYNFLVEERDIFFLN